MLSPFMKTIFDDQANNCFGLLERGPERAGIGHIQPDGGGVGRQECGRIDRLDRRFG